MDHSVAIGDTLADSPPKMPYKSAIVALMLFQAIAFCETSVAKHSLTLTKIGDVKPEWARSVHDTVRDHIESRIGLIESQLELSPHQRNLLEQDAVEYVQKVMPRSFDLKSQLPFELEKLDIAFGNVSEDIIDGRMQLRSNAGVIVKEVVKHIERIKSKVRQYLKGDVDRYNDFEDRMDVEVYNWQIAIESAAENSLMLTLKNTLEPGNVQDAILTINEAFTTLETELDKDNAVMRVLQRPRLLISSKLTNIHSDQSTPKLASLAKGMSRERAIKNRELQKAHRDEQIRTEFVGDASIDLDDSIMERMDAIHKLPPEVRNDAVSHDPVAVVATSDASRRNHSVDMHGDAETEWAVLWTVGGGFVLIILAMVIAVKARKTKDV